MYTHIHKPLDQLSNSELQPIENFYFISFCCVNQLCWLITVDNCC